MRGGNIKPSAAQCMVDMPPMYQAEPPPPRLAIDSYAMNTIGLHPTNGNRPIRRTNHFTSDFRDPFM